MIHSFFEVTSSSDHGQGMRLVFECESHFKCRTPLSLSLSRRTTDSIRPPPPPSLFMSVALCTMAVTNEMDVCVRRSFHHIVVTRFLLHFLFSPLSWHSWSLLACLARPSVLPLTSVVFMMSSPVRYFVRTAAIRGSRLLGPLEVGI